MMADAHVNPSKTIELTPWYMVQLPDDHFLEGSNCFIYDTKMVTVVTERLLEVVIQWFDVWEWTFMFTQNRTFENVHKEMNNWAENLRNDNVSSMTKNCRNVMGNIPKLIENKANTYVILHS